MPVHPDDSEWLSKMLGGVVDLPADVVSEYTHRALFLHSGGGYGALEPRALVDLLRYLGYQPKRTADPAADWHSLPTDGSVKVIAGPYGGEFLPGEFVGFGADGLLCIKYDDNGSRLGGETKEVRAAMVKRVQRFSEPEVAGNDEPAVLEPELTAPELAVGGKVSVKVEGELVTGATLRSMTESLVQVEKDGITETFDRKDVYPE